MTYADFLSVDEDMIWDAFLDNVAGNESELDAFQENYEDETGLTVRVSREDMHLRGAQLKDSAFANWLRQKVVQDSHDNMTELMRLVEDGHVRAWRVLTAPENWEPAAPNCGIHWSRRRDCALSFARDIEDGNPIFLVEALIPIDAIDIPGTVRANLSEEFGKDELEVRIFEDAAVKVISFEATSTPHHAPGCR